MLNSKERIDFIVDYITSYECRLKALNAVGLFDSAKLFELFALNVCSLYFNMGFINLNTEKPNYPYVDLVSEDEMIYCQVSTCVDVPVKIKETLTKISKSTDGKIKKIKQVCFFVLNNDSIEKIKDYCNESRIGNFDFYKDRDLITTKKIIEKAITDLGFQKSLYELLKKDFDFIKDDFHKYQFALEDSKNSLDEITDTIAGSYRIDLTEQIEKIDIDNRKIVFVSGPAGSGKSVLCKKILENRENVLFARGEKVASSNDVNEIWNFDFSKVLSFSKNKVYICIDALEFISDYVLKLDVFKELVFRISKLDNVILIASCRTSELSAFSAITSKFNVFEYDVKPLSWKEIKLLINKFPSLKNITKELCYQPLLSNPFYLNAALKIPDLKNAWNIADLRNYLWNEVICLGENKYKEIIKGIVFDRAVNFKLGSPSDRYDDKMISKLISEGIVLLDNKTKEVRLKYDIFEDICFEQHIDRLFDDCNGVFSTFFDDLSKFGRCVYRRFQIWVENKLFAKENRDKFLYSLIFKDVPIEWKKQTEIGIIKSNFCDDFFAEYGSKLIKTNQLLDFINLTNIYGFSIKYNKFPYNMILEGSGGGRRSIIKIIAKNLTVSLEDKYKTAIEKLIHDFSSQKNEDQEAGKAACDVLLYLLKKHEQKSKDGLKFYDYSKIKDYVADLYRLNKYSDSWIKNFINELKEDFVSNEAIVRSFSNDAIEDIIFNSGYPLASKYNRLIYNLIDLFYFGEIKKDIYSSLYDLGDPCYEYGLNKNAAHYSYSSNGDRSKLNVFEVLFLVNYGETLKWLLSFINRAVDNFKSKNKLNIYELNFVDSENKKQYCGVSEMWSFGEIPYVGPALLGDLLYYAKKTTFNLCNNENFNADFANNIKELILEKSNNIMCLSIVTNLGLRAEQEMPGYCIDFVSNLDLVLLDLSKRSSSGFRNAIIDRGKNYKDVCVDNDLRDYCRNLQLKHQSFQDKCCRIRDYLYSITNNDKNNAEKYLQIQLMDFRKTSIVAVKEGQYAIIPFVSGKAKNLTKAQDAENFTYNNLRTTIDEALKVDGENRASIINIDKCINIILELKSTTEYSLFAKDLISLICLALKDKRISSSKRNQYCSLWVELIGGNIILPNFDEYMASLPIFFYQLNKKIDDKTKVEIKTLILDKVIEKNGLGHQYDYDFIYCLRMYLKSDKKLASSLVNTILMLAKDEMDHQIFNKNYLKKFRKNMIFAFNPNHQPRLDGVDKYIEEDGQSHYESDKDNIIEKYLLKEESCDFNHFSLDDFDVRMLSHVFDCGFDLNNDLFCKIGKQYINLFLELCETNNSRDVHDIVGFYENYSVAKFFELNLKEQSTVDKTISVLFDGIDFQKFTSETTEFYLKIINQLTPLYFDSYDDREKRDFIEEVLGKLELKIAAIPVERVRQKLSSALILCLDSAGYGTDWSKFKTDYLYSDKMFLNEMFSKYGYLNFNDLINTICKLQYKKLLPEILLSINISFKKYCEKQGEIINSDLSDNALYILDEIMFYSFTEFEKEIKSDDELMFSFESILEILSMKYLDPKAAILLDEFRIH